MIPFADIVGVLLCAGLSRRFGDRDKLLEPLGGKPLVLHSAERLAELPIARAIAVTARGSGVPDWLPGRFEIVENPRPGRGKDSSLRQGLTSALRGGPRAVLLCLGDMPLITAAHVSALTESASDTRAAISWSGEWTSPPAVIPAVQVRAWLAAPHSKLRTLITAAGAIAVRADAAMLRDFDTPADFL